MQELIVHLEMLKSRVDMADIDSLIEYATTSLQKEKQQTIDFSIGAYQDISIMKGVSENLISENKILFEEYYNQTYNQNK